PPRMAWKDNVPPRAPQNLQANSTVQGVELSWTAPSPARDGDEARTYAVYRFDENQNPRLDDPRRLIAFCYEAQTRLQDRTAQRNQRYTYLVTALDRLHNESEPVQINVKSK
ncbi:MAG: glycoside hydrolase, partial [Runella slithyformis]